MMIAAFAGISNATSIYVSGLNLLLHPQLDKLLAFPPASEEVYMKAALVLYPRIS